MKANLSLCLTVVVTVLLLQPTFAEQDVKPALKQEPSKQPPSTQPNETNQSKSYKLLTQLGSTDAKEREDARIKLMALSRDDLPELRKAIEAQSPLYPGQAVVLREIVTQVWLSGESYASNAREGFLGISMTDVALINNPHDHELPRKSGVMVSDRLPGFDAYRMLETGDIMLSINGRATNSAVDVRLVIGSLKVGDDAKVRVLRNGKVKTVKVKLMQRPLAADLGELDWERFLQDRLNKAVKYYDKTGDFDALTDEDRS